MQYVPTPGHFALEPRHLKPGTDHRCPLVVDWVKGCTPNSLLIPFQESEYVLGSHGLIPRPLAPRQSLTIKWEAPVVHELPTPGGLVSFTMTLVERPSLEQKFSFHYSQQNVIAPQLPSPVHPPSYRSVDNGEILGNGSLPTRVDYSSSLKLDVSYEDKRSATMASSEDKDEPISESQSGFDMSLKDERIYLAVLCWPIFLAGWSDGTLGPLLPRIQEHYHIGFTIVSLIFICGTAGAVTGYSANIYCSNRLGLGKIIAIGSVLQVVTYSLQAPAPPFSVFCMAQFINFAGRALQHAQGNAFIATIPRHQATNAGIFYATYGAGALVSPLLATQFSQQKHWSFHFLISLGLSVANVVASIWTFRFKPLEYFIPETHAITSRQPRGNDFSLILRNKLVHALGLYAFVYVGTELSISGWIATYLIHERGGGPSSGYATSGFYAGLTLGRVALLWVNKKIGERHALYVYSVICIALELVVWFVPKLTVNIIVIAFVGLALGPFYTAAMNRAGAVIPRRILAGAIGWIAGCGTVGSAVFPFMTGAMAQHHGVKVVQPLLIGTMSATAFLWFVATRPWFENVPLRHEV